MALAKLYRVTDCNGQGWFVAGSTFSEAERKFIAWETANEPEETTELIDGIVLAGDLILGGNRDESFCNYQDVGYTPAPAPTYSFVLPNAMSQAGTELLDILRNGSAEAIEAAKAKLFDAIENYEEIPF